MLKLKPILDIMKLQTIKVDRGDLNSRKIIRQNEQRLKPRMQEAFDNERTKITRRSGETSPTN